MKRTIYALGVLIFCACQSEKSSSGELTSSIIATEQNEKALKEQLKQVEIEEAERQKELAENVTTMEFDKIVHDFGQVKELSENRTTFVVKNTGKKPLVIENVSASCGCTTPTKPEKPIPPGGKDKIEVVFQPKEGQLKEQAKSVTVTANTDPKMVVLEIKAFVNPK
jgi:hypothetical protein